MGHRFERQGALRRLSPKVAPLRRLAADDAAREWAERQSDAALLIEADAAVPLARHSAFWTARDEAGQIVGLAARLEAFAMPSVTICAPDGEAFAALLDRAGADRPFLLATEAAQPLPAGAGIEPAPVDPWMAARCESLADEQAEEIGDPREIAAFFRSQGAGFWSEAQFREGGCFGVRDPAGRLVSAGALGFVLERRSYGHIGPLVTEPGHRGRGYARAILSSLASRLALEGIECCGLFADAGDPNLPAFYERYGFERRGGFRFSLCTQRPGSGSRHPGECRADVEGPRKSSKSG